MVIISLGFALISQVVLAEAGGGGSGPLIPSHTSYVPDSQSA